MSLPRDAFIGFIVRQSVVEACEVEDVNATAPAEPNHRGAGRHEVQVSQPSFIAF